MKKAKDLIALRLRCLINKDFTFDQTVEDFHQDLKDTKVFNMHNFGWGFATGALIMLVIVSLTQGK